MVVRAFQDRRWGFKPGIVSENWMKTLLWEEILDIPVSLSCADSFIMLQSFVGGAQLRRKLPDEWMDPVLTYGHKLYVLLFQELKSHRHVFQLHLPEGGPRVVLSVHLLVTEDLQQGDEPQAVAQVQLQIHDPLVDALQVLVDPAGKGVLLDLLPRSVLRQVLLCGRHLW